MDIHNTGNASSVEIVNCIRKSGIAPDDTDLSQLAAAIKLLGGLSREEVQAMIDAAVSKIAVAGYEMCEFYFFRNPALRLGFQPADGGLLEQAATLYPEAWAYLQTVEGQSLCKTEEEWQNMATAIWHTNADGTTVGWGGVGGVPFYAPNWATGTLRLPDLRGMYVEAAGFDDLGVGGVHGDGIRNILGDVRFVQMYGSSTGTGALYNAGVGSNKGGGGGASDSIKVALDPSRVVPIANKNQVRAWGALACVFLGLPTA